MTEKSVEQLIEQLCEGDEKLKAWITELEEQFSEKSGESLVATMLKQSKEDLENSVFGMKMLCELGITPTFAIHVSAICQMTGMDPKDAGRTIGKTINGMLEVTNERRENDKRNA